MAVSETPEQRPRSKRRRFASWYLSQRIRYHEFLLRTMNLRFYLFTALFITAPVVIIGEIAWAALNGKLKPDEFYKVAFAAIAFSATLASLCFGFARATDRTADKPELLKTGGRLLNAALFLVLAIILQFGEARQVKLSAPYSWYAIWVRRLFLVLGLYNYLLGFVGLRAIQMFSRPEPSEHEKELIALLEKDEKAERPWPYRWLFD